MTLLLYFIEDLEADSQLSGGEARICQDIGQASGRLQGGWSQGGENAKAT